MNENTHKPVMLVEAIEGLQVKSNAWYIDATFGRGGHTREMLNAGGNVIAFDYDQQAIAYAHQHFIAEIKQGRLVLIRENFDHLEREIKKLRSASVTQPTGIARSVATTQPVGATYSISGVLFDFGTSSEQLTSAARGVSFQGMDEELDMRLDERLGVKAKDLLALLSEKQLADMFFEYGGEPEARNIAKKIVEQRKKGRFISTVGDLVILLEKTKRVPSHHLHPATKVFQALRIIVNDELGNIERALPQALNILAARGTIVTIAFHEGEDRIAKHTFRQWETEGKGECLTKKALKPTDQEITSNPRSRSAKLRVFQKN